MPIASDTAICNIALGRIGHTQFLADLASDTANEAENCRNLYPQARDETLEAASWPGATKRYKPSPLDATLLTLGLVPSGWTYAYALPGDIVSSAGVQKIYPGVRNPKQSEEVPFAIERDDKTQQDVILTDQQSPEIIYSLALVDVKRFTAKFVSAVAWKLAMELGLALRKDPGIGKQCADAYAFALAEAWARAKDGNRQDVEPDPDFIAARGASFRGRYPWLLPPG